MSRTTKSAATKIVYARALFDRKQGDIYSHVIEVEVNSDAAIEDIRAAAREAAEELEKRFAVVYEHDELELVAVILTKEYR